MKPLRYFSTDLAIWRGEDGQVRMIDAYCKHLGAHMGHGGKVHGNLLECPFHAWRWDGDGAAKEIPYARAIPPQARRKDCVPSYPVHEGSGIIWMWYHPEKAEPMWDLLVLPEYGSPDWSDFQVFRWNVYTALEHFADNAVDSAHFRYTHRTADMPDTEVKFDGYDRFTTAHAPMGTPKGVINGTIKIHCRGPGQAMTWFNWDGLAEIAMVAITTPIDRDHMYLVQCMMQPKAQADGPGARISQGLIREIARQADEDKLILDQHKHVDPPLVCDGDGPFGRNRAYHDTFLASRNRQAPAA